MYKTYFYLLKQLLATLNRAIEIPDNTYIPVKEKYKEREYIKYLFYSFRLFHLKEEGEITNYFNRLYSTCFTDSLKNHLDESLVKSISTILIRKSWKYVTSNRKPGLNSLVF